MMTPWPLVSISDVLIERNEIPTEIDLLTGKVRIVDKVSFNDGKIHLRASHETSTNMILVKPGDILVSGINAAKGAIAIHDPAAQDPIAATIHYSAYQVDASRGYPKFIWWLLRSEYFRDLLSQYVPGGIKTELKSKRLLPIPIPLPSVYEQRRIVEKIEKITKQIELAKKARTESIKELSALSTAYINAYMDTLNVNSCLANVLVTAPRNGWSPSCDNIEGGTPVLTLSAVTGWHFNSAGYKLTSLPTNDNAHYWAHKGDLLMTRSNTPELVGHAAIYNGSPSPAIYPDLMMKLPVDQTKVSTKFVWYWLQSTRARDFVRRSAKGTSPTMKKISQPIVQNIPFPAGVILDEQKTIVQQIERLNSSLEAISALQVQTYGEMDAILATVLDKAFKGQL